MSREYSVPKRLIHARVVLLGQPATEMQFFLGERAETHGGPETLGDLLNSNHAFVPAVDDSDHIVLLNPDNLLVVSIVGQHGAQEREQAEARPRAEGEIHAAAQVAIEGGTALRGMVSYWMPESKRRLQDFLNISERFLALQDGTTVHLINKRRITKVLPD